MLYKLQFHPYQRKFKRPLQTSHGIWEIREGIILQLASANGQISWGEIAPLSWFGSESLAQALNFCKQLPSQISEETIFSIPAEFPACQFGFESAILFGAGTEAPPLQSGKMLQRYSGLLPAGETAISALQMLWQKGHRTFKWKIGVSEIDRELQMFDRLVREMHKIGDREQLFLRLDANCGLNYQQTQTWLQACDRINLMSELFAKIEFLEQPMPVEKFEEMLELNAAFATDIALDESAANLDRIQDCYRRGWRGIFVIKPAIAGSPSQLQKFCLFCKIDAVFSSVFETKIGRQSALNLADRISPHSSRALGFGTDSWFDDNY